MAINAENRVPGLASDFRTFGSIHGHVINGPMPHIRFTFVAVIGITAILSSVNSSSGAPAGPAPGDIGKQLSILAAHFEEPLITTASASAEENGALLEMLNVNEKRATVDDFSAIESFLAGHPNSGWGIALLTNLGLLYYHYGYFSKAIDAWEQAFRAGVGIKEPHAKALVDRALGEL